MKAYVEAYGCTLNVGESREIRQVLSSRGWDVVDDPADADLVVLATCVVIDTTEREMLKRIKQLSASKRLLITGCLATACRDKAERIAPNSQFLAPADLDSLDRMVDRVGAPIPSKKDDSYAIVPIATGCRGSCSYCITRIARGDLRSRSPESIIEAVRRVVEDGPREVQMTAQDTASYGTDIGTDLPALVKSVCGEPGPFRLRVGMMNPKSVLPIVDGISKMYLESKVFKFLHLPIQSASDSILRDMDRGYTLGNYRTIISKVREKTPRITISTDIIVGYPGESSADHSSNLEFIAEIKPDIVNVTRFSPRPGTKAARESRQVVGWKAKDRSREITLLRFEVALAKNQGWIGEEVNALSTERGKKGTTIFRNDEYKQIVVHGSHPLGKFHKIEITGATSTYLTGKRAGD